MSEAEQHEHEPEAVETVEPHEPEPDADDEPGPSDDEQEAEAEDDEPTPEPEPEPEARGLSEKALADRDKKADQSFDTYTRRIATLYEEDAQDLIPCPMCLITPRAFVNKHMAGRLDPEHADLVKQFLGLARPVDLKPSKRHHRCGDCDGVGWVGTDSQVPGNEKIGCEDCRGYGFVPPPGAPQNGHVDSETPRPLLAIASPDVSDDDPDEWGEPKVLPNGMQNPNWGRMPHRKIDVAPFGKTAGLSAQDAMPAGTN